MKYFSILLTTLLFNISYINAEPKKEAKKPVAVKSSAAFSKLKSLAGTWSGTKGSGKEAQKITVHYKVSSGGSSVIETHFPGKPFEMVSVYNDVNGNPQMTHYCALQNQPTLKMDSSKGNTLKFSFIKGTNLDASKDKHMHSLTLKIIDTNKIVQEWIEHSDGKAGETSVLKLTRAK